MSVTVTRALPGARRLAAALAALALASPAWSQQRAADGANDQDPAVIVTRTVQPRIAYRGVPLEANPVHARATVFPAKVFHQTLDGVMGRLVGDDALGQTGSAGVAQLAIHPALFGTPTLLGTGNGAGGSAVGLPGGPVGAGIAGGAMGGAAGAIGRATGNLGGTITGAISGAMALPPGSSRSDTGAGR